jgi:hypothetical protein
MYSIITSVKDKKVLNSTLLPSLVPLEKELRDKQKPPFQLVVVEGEDSLARNYNIGIKQCIWQLKFFVHCDLEILDVSIFSQVSSMIDLLPDTGLVGLAGTMTEKTDGFWWNCPREFIVGQVICTSPGCSDEYWKWECDKDWYEVFYVDGMFMATPLDLEFSEDIKGFHFYDMDYCNLVRQKGYKIRVIPSLTRHRAARKDLSTKDIQDLQAYYQRKWNLL